MRDPSRIEPLLRTIKTLWLKCPDLRLGQLLVNAVNPKEPCSEVFNIEDSTLQSRLNVGLYGATTVTPATEMIGFEALWIGDRFNSGDVLWTKIGVDVARRHSPESVALGDRGYGYVGDAICSFDADDRVLFVTPTQG